MNARTHYISLLKSAKTVRSDAPLIKDDIWNGLIEWILCRDYLDTDDSLEKLASDLNISKEDLSASLFLGTGSRLRTIKKELRLSDAQLLLLKYPEIPICKISKYVGIEDKSNFRKLFKDTVGCTPADWRNGKGGACLCRLITHRSLSQRG